MKRLELATFLVAIFTCGLACQSSRMGTGVVNNASSSISPTPTPTQTPTPSPTPTPTPSGQPLAAFGVDISDISNLPAKPPYGQIRLWDVDGGVNWNKINPDQGKYDYSILDKYVSYAQSQNIDIDYVVSITPCWASTAYDSKTKTCPADGCKYQAGACRAPSKWSYLTDFLTSIVSRYNNSATSGNPQAGCPSSNPTCHGVIKYYEIWNEPSVPSEWDPSQTYNGMDYMQLFASLNTYAIGTIRKVDPVAKIFNGASFSPSFLNDFWKDGGPKNFDAINYHMYSQESLLGVPEAGIYQASSKLPVMKQYNINLPLVNTEGGSCGDIAKITETQQSEYAARYALLNMAMKAKSFSWYKWDGCVDLYDKGSHSLTPVGTSYFQVQNWVLGAKLKSATTGCFDNNNTYYDMSSCIPKPDWSRTYVFDITQGDGHAGQAVWYLYASGNVTNWAQTTTYNVPSQYNFNQYTDTSGSANCFKGGKLTVGAEPYFLTFSASCL